MNVVPFTFCKRETKYRERERERERKQITSKDVVEFDNRMGGNKCRRAASQ